MTTEEHNPDGLTPEQYGAPEWRLLSLNDELIDGDEADASGNGTDWQPHGIAHGATVAQFNLCTYRRRVSAEAEGGAPCVSQEALRERDCVIADLKREATDLRAENERLKRHLEISRACEQTMCKVAEEIAIQCGLDTDKAEPPDVVEAVIAMKAELAAEKQRREDWSKAAEVYQEACKNTESAIAAAQESEKKTIALLRRCYPFLVHALCSTPSDSSDYKEARQLCDEVNPIAHPEVEAAFAADAKRQAALTGGQP